MVTLIIGGSGSGKSAYAEKLLTDISDVNKKYYIATMKIIDEETKIKVEKHRLQRMNKEFETIEQPVNITNVINETNCEDSAYLLECVSNLTANEMFVEGIISEIEVIEKVQRGISELAKYAKHLIIVTNNVFDDGIKYDEQTLSYMNVLAIINRKLAALSDEVYEVVAGIPVALKKERQ